jgi:hypothetical protein
MKIFEENVEEAANRLSEGTLLFWLLFAFIGIIVSVTRRWVEGWEFLGTYHEVEGLLALGFGVALSVWSFLTLWICYFRRVSRVFPYMWSRIIWFWLLVGFCLTVSVLPHFIYMPWACQIISKVSPVVLFISAHFFHKRVKLAVSKLIKQGEDNQQNE